MTLSQVTESWCLFYNIVIAYKTRLPGAGKGGMENYYLMDREFLFGIIKKSWKSHSCDDYTTL